MNNAHTSLPDAAQEPPRPFPAPLTPPQSDLRGLPFMPLDTCRLLDSDLFALSTGDGFKCAVALWCKAWQQVPAGSLPHNDRVLAHLSGAGGRWSTVRATALHGWVVCSDGRLYHPVIAQKANQAWKARLAQRARAARRWGREPEAEPQPTEQAACHGNARAYARESERESETLSLRSRGDDEGDLAQKRSVRGRARVGRGAARAPHPLEEQAARLKQRSAALGHGLAPASTPASTLASAPAGMATATSDPAPPHVPEDQPGRQQTGAHASLPEQNAAQGAGEECRA